MNTASPRRGELLSPDDLRDLEKYLQTRNADEGDDRLLAVMALLRAMIECTGRPALPAPGRKEYRGTRLEQWLPEAVRGHLDEYHGALTLSRLMYRSFQNVLTRFKEAAAEFQQGGLAPQLVHRDGSHELRWVEQSTARLAEYAPSASAAGQSPADEEYERAKPLVGERTLGSLRNARRHLLAALEVDPNHGNALGLLSICDGLLVDYGYGNPEGLKASLDAMKARLGRPDNSPWHMYPTALGVHEMQQTRDFPTALRYFRAAERICEKRRLGCVSAAHWRSELLSIHGDHAGAITLMDQVCARMGGSLAPRFLQTKRANAYFLAREYDRAEQLLLRLIQGHIEGHAAISKTFVAYARICAQRGIEWEGRNRGESIRWFENGARALDQAVEAGEVYFPRQRRGVVSPPEESPPEQSVYVLTERVLLYKAAAKLVGEYAHLAELSARAVFDRAIRHGVHVPLYFQALIHNALGDRDATIRSLWSAVERGCTRVIYCKVDPRLDNLHGDLDYEDICAAVFERPLR